MVLRLNTIEGRSLLLIKKNSNSLIHTQSDISKTPVSRFIYTKIQPSTVLFFTVDDDEDDEYEPPKKKRQRKRPSVRDKKELESLFAPFFQKKTCPRQQDCLRAIAQSKKDNGTIHV